MNKIIKKNMMGVFKMEGKPETDNRESSTEYGIVALEGFSQSQIKNIDFVLGKTGQDLVTLKNFFDVCNEDKIDTAPFVERLSILSKNETSEELNKLIEEWWSKVF